MLNLHLLQYLKDNGFGTAINTDLFFELLPLGKYGIAAISRGGVQSVGLSSAQQNVDFYFRGRSNELGADSAEKVRQFLAASYGSTCTLPIVPDKSNRQYKRCRFTNIDNVENLGQDEEDRIVYRLGFTVIYNKN